MNPNKEEKVIKATREDAEQFDAIIKEIEQLKEKSDEQSKERRDELYQEYYDKITQMDWSDEVFEENGKKGLRNVKGETVVPAIYDGFGNMEPYHHKGYRVCAYLDGKAALVERDGKGTPFTEFEYSSIGRIPYTQTYYVAKGDDKEHFALMAGGKVITPYEIDAIYDVCNGSILLGGNGKVGALYFGYDLIYIEPIYDQISTESVGEDYIFTKDGREGRVTYDKVFISNEEFDKLPEEEQDRISDEGFICAPVALPKKWTEYKFTK